MKFFTEDFFNGGSGAFYPELGELGGNAEVSPKGVIKFHAANQSADCAGRFLGMNFSAGFNRIKKVAVFEFCQPSEKSTSCDGEIDRDFRMGDAEFMNKPHNSKLGRFGPVSVFLQFKLFPHKTISGFQNFIFNFIRAEETVRTDGISRNKKFSRGLFPGRKKNKNNFRKYVGNIENKHNGLLNYE